MTKVLHSLIKYGFRRLVGHPVRRHRCLTFVLALVPFRRPVVLGERVVDSLCEIDCSLREQPVTSGILGLYLGNGDDRHAQVWPGILGFAV